MKNNKTRASNQNTRAKSINVFSEISINNLTLQTNPIRRLRFAGTRTSVRQNHTWINPSIQSNRRNHRVTNCYLVSVIVATQRHTTKLKTTFDISFIKTSFGFTEQLRSNNRTVTISLWRGSLLSYFIKASINDIEPRYDSQSRCQIDRFINKCQWIVVIRLSNSEICVKKGQLRANILKPFPRLRILPA